MTRRDPTPATGGTVQLKRRWSAHLATHKLKTSKPRELIVDHFLRTRGHVSVDELLRRVRRDNPRIGHATVYRTLRLLTEAGLAVARHFGEGQTRFEVADSGSTHHDHLICAKCGLILEFECNEIEEWQQRIAKQLGGFQVVRHKLELYCLCPKAMGVPGGRCPDEEQRRARTKAT